MNISPSGVAGMTAYYNEFDPFAAAWLRELMADGLIPAGDVDERSIVDVQPQDLTGYDQCHFFAGIGGWAEALRLAGWGDRPVWTGSCPCQPFSVAGKGKGAADERHLWPAFARLIRECRPPVVFGEQVEGAVRLGWLDGVFADLEGAGYACGATVLGAHSVGAPHIRQRLYWVAERMANAEGVRRDEKRTHRSRGTQRTQSQGEIGRTFECRELGGLADSGCELEGRGTRPRETQSGWSCGQSARCSDAGRLGDTNINGREGWLSGGADSARETMHGQARHYGATHWSDTRIIHCRDGKARRVPTQSGFQFVADGLSADVDGLRIACEDRFPLAGKIPNRTGLLRGAGNAIVPSVAAEFVMAYMKQLEEDAT